MTVANKRQGENPLVNSSATSICRSRFERTDIFRIETSSAPWKLRFHEYVNAYFSCNFIAPKTQVPTGIPIRLCERH